MMAPDRPPIHVCLVAIPDAMASSLSGLYEVLNCFKLLGSFDDSVPERPPFHTEVVAATRDQIRTASGLPMAAHRTFDDVDSADVVIVPSVMVEKGEWRAGRYPALVTWLRSMSSQGATLCSACSGVLLLAETGLLDGREATIHWAYARTFRSNFPAVELRLERALVATGERQQFVMSGASASWHDLALYLVARHAGPTAALAITKFLLLQWHEDGQAPYIVFEPVTDHGDAVVSAAQEWLRLHYSVPAPVEQMVQRSGIAERTFKRRFSQATGLSPIAYVQHLRVEEAKRRLERTRSSVDQISWNVGYEDPAFFRRLFKRVTGITPRAYRRKFTLREP